MKNVLFVGQFNTLYQEISTYLGRFFNVQMRESELLIGNDLLAGDKPDIVLMDLQGMGEVKNKIFYELRTNYMDVPLLCLVSETKDVMPEMIVGIQKYKALKFPAGNERIVETICELLGLHYNRTKRLVETAYVRKCVLAIDDNEMQLRMLNEMLKEDYDVMLANSAMKALTIIGKRAPDVILLDYEMPICDGRMALQMIREVEDAKNIPVIFLTGVQDAAHIRAVLELQPSGYLLKPAARDMLRKEIRKAIYRR